jgi:hypothetical protein
VRADTRGWVGVFLRPGPSPWEVARKEAMGAVGSARFRLRGARSAHGTRTRFRFVALSQVHSNVTPIPGRACMRTGDPAAWVGIDCIAQARRFWSVLLFNVFGCVSLCVCPIVNKPHCPCPIQ